MNGKTENNCRMGYFGRILDIDGLIIYHSFAYEVHIHKDPQPLSYSLLSFYSSHLNSEISLTPMRDYQTFFFSFFSSFFCPSPAPQPEMKRSSLWGKGRGTAKGWVRS